MKWLSWAMLLVLLSACGGNGSPTALGLFPTAPAGTSYPPNSIFVVNDSGIPTPVAGQSPAPITFAVTVFAPGASGNASPLGTISGPATGLVGPRTLAVDAFGRIYVGQDDAINVFAANSSGNVAPVETISGSNTGLRDVAGLAIVPNGDIYVADAVAGEVWDFGPYSPGSHNVAPVGAISVASPGCLASGRNALYVCASTTNGSPQIASYPIGVFGPSVMPSSSFTSSAFGALSGVAIDRSGNAYVASGQQGVLDVFAGQGGVTPSGAVSPAFSYSAIDPASGNPAFDSAGNVYTANTYGDAVDVYAAYPNAVAGAPPASIISGSLTGLSRPYAVVVH